MIDRDRIKNDIDRNVKGKRIWKRKKSRNRKGKIVQKEKAKEIQLEKGNKSPNYTIWKK